MRLAMKHARYALAWVALACLPAVSQAAGDVAASTCYGVSRVIDPALPADVVARDMAALVAAAEQGSPYAAYLLGTLYRWGPAHPASRLPLDRALADQWLRRAALSGHLGAMAGLAENALVDGRTREALVIALARVHYGKRSAAIGAMPGGRRFEHGLVDRAFAALGQPATESLQAELLAEVNAFVDAHGAGIESGLADAKTLNAGRDCPVSGEKERRPLEIRAVSSVLLEAERREGEAPQHALFHLEVGADGRVDRALLLDFSPGPEAVKPLQRAAEGMLFNKLKGAPPRRALFPLTMH